MVGDRDEAAVLTTTTIFTTDFNRHSRTGKPGTAKASDRTLNMLFCDGHAALVSAKEAAYAIRFAAAAAP